MKNRLDEPICTVRTVLIFFAGVFMAVLAGWVVGCHAHGRCTVEHTTKSWDELRQRVDEAYPAENAE